MTIKSFIRRNKVIPLEDLKDSIVKVAQKDYFYEVYLCGDYARGRPTPNSVVDIYVYDKELFPNKRIVEFERDLKREIGKPVFVLAPGEDPKFTRSFTENAIRFV